MSGKWSFFGFLLFSCPTMPTRRTRLPQEISICVIDCLVDDQDRKTLAVCSLVCQTWFSITRPHLFKDVVVSSNKTVSFSKILASPARQSMVATSAHIRTVNFPGLPRLLHIYPPTGEDLLYANAVGEILTAIPQLTALRLGSIHWPNIALRKATLSQMNLDSVVMMDLSMLVQVISNLEALESLRLNVHFARTFPGPISSSPPSLQRLKTLDCDHISDHQFFPWLTSLAPLPPITSLSLGDQLFPHTPGALQLIMATSETLRCFKASRILSPQVCLPNLFHSHKDLRSVTLLVKRDCSPPELFLNRETTYEARSVDERGKSYTVVNFKLGGDKGTEDV
ncbi:hypothetical protein B0H10DRAFT_2109957 [Mycena sp. CBHHK59/15]|nr:hypothetical protein B0H10DRAFT_2201299 [Mycena sp. CBHHK59/15]KAJ6567867.1 hypothetical protein B0H10DRAFT_2109957 [Mycena sp. CBHHK59/15]